MKTIINLYRSIGKGLKFMLLALGIFLMLQIFSCKKTDNSVSNNSNWTQVGGSFDNQIYNVISDKYGNIYMSGGFIWNIMVWNGSNWSNLGDVNTSPFTGGLYWPITIDKDGNVYAVGRINVPQANAQYHIAKWVKATNTWINLTANNPLFDNGIYSLITDSPGNLYVSGNASFMSDSVNGKYIYKWNGSNWSSIGGRLRASEIINLHVDNNDNLFASLFNNNFSPCVSKWNGSSWDELGGTNTSDFGTGQINCINSDSKGNIYAGGYFAKGDSAFNIFKWTKSTNKWNSLYTYGSSSQINSIVFDSTDTLYVAGDFVNNSNYRYVAKYQINKWADYGNLKANNNIISICFDNSGNMYAGGMFTNSSNKYYVAVYKKR